MQLALRPYVTTGVAIVGASVIAVAPIVPTPTEVQIPNPLVQVDSPVRLAANEIEDAINALAFAGAEVLVSLATLPAPLVAQLLGTSPEVAELLLTFAALGLSGPVIGGVGATGAALQDLVNTLGSGNPAALINALIGAPATLIDGVVNGGYGPNLSPFFGFPSLVGGLISPLRLDGTNLIIPGAIPALQGLVSQLLSAFGGGGMVSTLAAPVETEGQIEGAVNFLLFNLVASPIVTITGLLGSALAPVLGEELAAALPLAALGLLGPLISGPGAVGSAIQDVVDSLGSGNLAGVLTALIGAPATIIDGVVNGGYGPNLQPLLPELPPAIPPGIPVTSVLAGGLIPNPGFLYPALLQGLGLKVGGTGATLLLPGVFPTLQGLISRVLGLVGLAPAPEALTAETTAETMSINSVDTSNQRLVTLDLNDSGSTQDTGGQVSGTNAGTQPEDNQQGATGGGQAGNDGQQQGSTPVSGQTGGTTTPTTGGSPNGATDMTDGSKFEPEIKADDTEGNNENGSNTTGATTTTGTEVSGNAVENTPDEGSDDGGGEE